MDLLLLMLAMLMIVAACLLVNQRVNREEDEDENKPVPRVRLSEVPLEKTAPHNWGQSATATPKLPVRVSAPMAPKVVTQRTQVYETPVTNRRVMVIECDDPSRTPALLKTKPTVAAGAFFTPSLKHRW